MEFGYNIKHRCFVDERRKVLGIKTYWLSTFSKINKIVVEISATNDPSETVLDSKQMGGYLVSPHIKTRAVAFLQAE